MPIPAIASYQMPGSSDLPENRVSWTPEPNRSVLLIHDMQNYFLHAFMQKESPLVELVQHIKRIKRECHAFQIPVVYSAQPGGQTPEQRGLLQDFWGDGIPNHPDEQSIHTDLSPDSNDIVLTKWRYSAFKKTNLLELVKEQGRDQLIICGVYAHIGCLLTASEAFMQDIQPFFIADAVADFSFEHHQMAIQYAADRCAVTMSTEQLIDEWKKSLSDGYHALPMSLQEVQKQVAELLQEDPVHLSVDEDLIHRGLDSIRIMSLVEKWRSSGAEVTFVDLAERPTLSEWWSLLSAQSEKIASRDLG